MELARTRLPWSRWASVLRLLRNWGMVAPTVAVGDGALGLWRVIADIWPKTLGQRCWLHDFGNVLDKLPQRLRPKAKRILHAIMHAEMRKEGEAGIADFRAEFAPKQKRAVDCLEKDPEALLTFLDLPAEHWKHLRTTNPIESAFATLRLRQRVTKGAGFADQGTIDGL